MTIRNKVRLGQVLRMKYSGSKNDPNPTIVYLTTLKHKNGHQIVSGFNLNYLSTFKDQQNIIQFVRQFNDPQTAYTAVKVYFPDYTTSYRVYREDLINSANILDTSTAKLKKI